MPGRLASLSAYDLRHLGQHLVAAGADDRLRRLLHLDTGAGRNAWYEAKWAVDDLDGYQADLQAAWRSSVSDTGDQVDCALIAASISQLARQLPPGLLAVLVDHGIVSPAYAVQSVAQSSVAGARAAAIVALAGHLDQDHLLQLLDLARSIDLGPVRARALAALAPCLPVRLQDPVVAEVLRNATTDSWPFDEVETWLAKGVFARLAPLAARDRGSMASLLRLARALGDDRGLDAARCTRILATLIPHLDPEEARATTAEALEVARSIRDLPGVRRSALVALLPFLPWGRRRRLLAFCRFMTLGDAKERVDHLAEVVVAGPEPERRDALADLVRRLPEVDFAGHRLEAVKLIAPHVRPGSPEAVALLDHVGDMADQEYRIEALAAVVHLAPPGRRAEIAVEVAEHERGIRFDHDRWALTRVAPFLPDGRRNEVLERALVEEIRLDDDGPRIRLLADLLVHQHDDDRRRRVRPFLDAVVGASDEDQSVALARVAPALGADELATALDRAASLKDVGWRPVKAVVSLAPHLPPVLLERAIDVVLDQAPEHRADGLVGLAPHCPPTSVARLLDAALALEDLKTRGSTVLGLLPYASAERASAALTELLETCRAPGPPERLDVLVAIAPRLLPAVREEAVALALTIARDRVYYAGQPFVLRRLAELLPDDGRAPLLAVAEALDHPVTRCDALEALAPVLPPDLMPAALDLARSTWRHHSGRALVALFGHLPDGLLDAAVELIEEEDGEPGQLWRADAIATLSRRLAPPALERVFRLARGFDEMSRAKALTGLYPYLRGMLQAEALALLDENIRYGGAQGALREIPPHLTPALWPRALEMSDRVEEVSGRGHVLAAFAPHIPPDLLPALLDRVDRLGWRAGTLRAVAPHLPPELLPRALEIAQAAQRDGDRGDSLAALAPHLSGEELRAALPAAAEIGDVDAKATAEAALALALAEGTALVTAVMDACQVERPERRVALLRDLAPHLDRIAVPWHQALRTLARRGRPQLLADLEALAPALGWRREPALAASIFDSITRSATWWP